MLRNNVRYVLSIFLVGLFSCSNQIESGVTVDTSSGVREITYHDSAPPQVDPYSIEESTQFGVDQGSDTYLLTSAFARTISDDGSLYVLDVLRAEAHRFSSEGKHLGQFGRRGQGPGEFSILQDLIYHDGRLYTNDPFSRHVTVMDPLGGLIETIPCPEEVPISRLIIPYSFGDEAGYILIKKDVRLPYVEGTVTEAQFRILRLDRLLNLRRSLLDSTRTFDVVRIGGRPLSLLHENHTPATGIAPGMPIAWSYGEDFRIDFLNPNTEAQWAVTIPHVPLPFSKELKDSQLQLYESITRSNEASRRVDFPNHLPHLNVMDAMIWDDVGRLWVQEYRDYTATGSVFRFYVFSKDGEWLFRQDLPKRPSLITGEGYYAGSEAADGSPLVQFYRFVGR